MLLRQLRGALGITLLWALMWLPLGVGFGIWRYLSLPRCHEIVDGRCFGWSAWSVISAPVWLFTAWGAITGFLFATLLSGAERRRSVSELSVLRLSLWGAVCAFPLPLVLAVLIGREEGWSWWLAVPVVLAIVVGSVCAALTAAAARRSGPAVVPDRAA